MHNRTPEFIHEVSMTLSAIEEFGETHPIAERAIAEMLDVAPAELKAELSELAGDVAIMPGVLECRLHEIRAEYESAEILRKETDNV